MNPGAIVVVGGSGAVGREVVGLLAGGPDEVVVVGRDGAAATAVAATAARERGGPVSARRADVSDAADRRAAVAGARVVVVCVERANAQVARDALEEGADVVDISASAEILGRVAALDDVARWHRRSAVTNVGLAPGLTNLLARACVDRLPGARGVDITVLVGLGERHGVDAIRWTVDGLAAPAAAQDDQAVAAPAGAPAEALPARVVIPGFGARVAHPFPFADQAALRSTLGIPVTTRLCFDSRLVTAAAFALRPGLGRLPRRARRAVTRAAAHTHLGDDRWAVHVTATAPGGRTATAHASGRRQSHATAVVTAHVVRELRASAVPPGAHPIDEAVALGKALVEVEAAGIAVHRP
jgi:Saccharopine dehydrogenase NADP binding domain